MLFPNGVDCERFFPGDMGWEAVQALGLESGRYYLNVGRLEPRKNHTTLLRAWAQLNVPRPTLVIVGQRHFMYREMLDMIRTLHLERDVFLLKSLRRAVTGDLPQREGIRLQQLG